jgi:outer membrane protein assembly factor BamB
MVRSVKLLWLHIRLGEDGMARIRRWLVWAPIALAVAAFATTASSATSPDWTAFLANPRHSSVSGDPTVTPANAGSLSKAWTFVPAAFGSPRPSANLYSTPAVVKGVVYQAAHTGVFYALSLSTGAVLWKNDLKAYQPNLGCGAHGFIASPTVAADPATGKLTVYDVGGDGYLYALNAATGAVKWKVVTRLPSTTVNDYMSWSSPTVANGHVYVGISSSCDNPLVAGELRQYSTATGQLQHVYHAMAGTTAPGATIWSTAAATSSDVYVSTGNPKSATSPQGDSNSLVDLDAGTLARKAKFTVPSNEVVSDGDFGASPTLFTATLNGISTPMVGACNKNGRFYAVNATTMKLVWQFRLDSHRGPCFASAIWDGTRLFVAANTTTIAGDPYPGSIRRLNPATGAVIWARGLGASVLGSPTLSGGGVIGVATWDSDHPNALYLVNASNGNIVRTISTASREFAQPVFADGYLLAARLSGLTAYRLPG